MRQFISSILFFLSIALNAQTQNPVVWTTSYKPLSADEGEILIQAGIEKGWHMYSIRPTDAGPIPTSFTFTPSDKYKLIGKTIESEAHEDFDPAFDAKLFSFSGKAEFRQKVKLTGKSGFSIPVKVEFMICNDRMCLPPKTLELSVKTL